MYHSFAIWELAALCSNQIRIEILDIDKAESSKCGHTTSPQQHTSTNRKAERVRMCRNHSDTEGSVPRTHDAQPKIYLVTISITGIVYDLG